VAGEIKRIVQRPTCVAAFGNWRQIENGKRDHGGQYGPWCDAREVAPVGASVFIFAWNDLPIPLILLGHPRLILPRGNPG
jgi:hypothetical protein